MTNYNYSFKKFNENMAKTIGLNLPISTRHCIEICNFIKNNSVDGAKDLLSKVIEKKVAVPFKRFTGDVGHKKKIGYNQAKLF